MRTQLFIDFANLSNDFKSHVDEIWTLSRESRDQLIPAIIELLRSETTSQSKKIQEKTVDQIEAPANSVLKSLGVLEFISRTWNPIQDSAEACLEDFEALSLIPEDKREEGHSFLLSFFKAIEGERTKRLEKIFSHAVLPGYSGLSTAADLRAVFSNVYDTSDDQGVDDYQPELQSRVPVVLLKFSRDSGVPEEFVFQATESQLLRIIERLTITHKELVTLKNTVTED